MYIKTEFDINTFKAWGNGRDTKNTIIEHDKDDTFNNWVEDIFPDGCTDKGMNDFLWFERNFIFEALGISEEEEEDEENEDLDEDKI